MTSICATVGAVWELSNDLLSETTLTDSPPRQAAEKSEKAYMSKAAKREAGILNHAYATARVPMCC